MRQDPHYTMNYTMAKARAKKPNNFKVKARPCSFLSTAPDANQGWTARKRILADLHNAVEGEPQASGEFPNALANDCAPP